MKQFGLLLLFMLTLAQLPSVVYAQGASAAVSGDFTATPEYNAMVRDAIDNRPDAFRFDRFRRLYTQSRYYEPVTDDLVQRMQTLAFEILHGQDENAQTKAREAYLSLLMTHLGNFDVLSQAYSLALQDPRCGNPDFFNWLRAGFMRYILATGTGQNLRDAYNVMTMGEERAVLAQLSVKVLSSEARRSGAMYYNIHEVQDLKTGHVHTLIFNVTIPMKVLNARERSLPPPVSLSRDAL